MSDLTRLLEPKTVAHAQDAAKAALENLRREFGKKNPGMVAAWDRAWPQFVPFLQFDAAIAR